MLLKLQQLEKLLPEIERSVIPNVCPTRTELREAYGLPLTQPQFHCVSEVKMAESAVRTEEERPAADNQHRDGDREEWKLVSSKRKVKAARERLINRYCDVLASFRRGQHVLAGDRVRELVLRLCIVWDGRSRFHVVPCAGSD
ncbi:hypothetical protein PsorP6_000366 [Peronosclerospora sorghi]|uniref:Uncharacterized protein n=1 Tax=Peronosclerospora sorghi TaxID=230839 RepID=A0ACC0WUL8_9STRA|nr:hypothetical protein PsorP6_000366 [Peronosclerospora sorghi]